jgi:hypothetical protein
VARDPGGRQSLPSIVVGILLLACTVSGLAAGAGARRVVDNSGFRAILGTGSGMQSKHATSSVSPATSPAASPSAGSGVPTVTASVQSTGFKLAAQASPTTVTVGQQFSVTVTVTAHHSSTPLAGVPCALGPPGNGRGSGPSLFSHWPKSMVSDSVGKVVWTLQAPNMPAGTYDLVVSATGTDDYYVWAVVPLTIS